MNVAEARKYILEKYGTKPNYFTFHGWLHRGMLKAEKAARGEWNISAAAIDEAMIPRSSRRLRTQLEMFPASAIDALPSREKLVLMMHAGIGGFQPTTLEKIGKELKVTRQRIHRIKTVALSKLAGD